MPKFLRVEMSDGSVWDIPAEVIAKDRATYYAQKDLASGDGTFDEVYASEFAEAMRDGTEILDWANNNMNWPDVQPHAVRVPTPPPPPADYEAEWCNADKSIVKAREDEGDA